MTKDNGASQHKMPVSSIPIYGNAIIQAPDGEQLCRIDDKRAEWYITHPEDIAYEIPNGDGPRIVRLRFEPSGREGADDPFLQGDKRNECAVCGDADRGLTRHHIVPWAYRKHLPQVVIKNCFHDIIPMCVKCHGEYEETVLTYKEVLCEKYNVPLVGIQPKYSVPFGRAVKSAYALVRHKDKMPPKRIEELGSFITDYLDRPYTADDLTELTTQQRWQPTGGKSHGLMLVENLALADLQEFYEGWRKHFLENARPQFMPDHWSVTRKVRGT